MNTNLVEEDVELKKSRLAGDIYLFFTQQYGETIAIGANNSNGVARLNSTQGRILLYFLDNINRRIPLVELSDYLGKNSGNVRQSIYSLETFLSKSKFFSLSNTKNPTIYFFRTKEVSPETWKEIEEGDTAYKILSPKYPIKFDSLDSALL